MISTVGLILGTAIAIGGAKAGYGYWALVAMAVASPLTTTAGLWLATGWVPGMPLGGPAWEETRPDCGGALDPGDFLSSVEIKNPLQRLGW